MAPDEDFPPFSVLITSSGPSLLRQVLLAIRTQDYSGTMEVMVAGREPGDQSGDERAACEEARASYFGVEGRGTSWLAAARNQAMDHCSGTLVLLLDGDTMPPPWHLTGCARALRDGGSYVMLYARRDGLLQCYQVDHGALANLFGTVPASGPELRHSENLYDSAAGNLAFHRSLADRGFRFDETVPEDAIDPEFACRLDDSGYRSIRTNSWNCVRLPRQRRPFQAELLVEAEHAFLKKHPHALLQGSYELALEPSNGGRVSILVNVRDGTPRRLRRSLGFLNHQKYQGERELLVFSREQLSAESVEVCRRAGVRAVVGPAEAAGDSCAAEQLSPMLLPPILPAVPGMPEFPPHPSTPALASSALASSWQRATAAALPIARGQFILYVEAGVLLAPHHMQNCVNILRYQGDSLVCWGRALPLDQLLLFDTLTPFSRFHLSTEQALQLVSRDAGVERIPLPSLLGPEPYAPDHLFLSREMAERVASQLGDVVPQPVPLPPPITLAGARSVRLDALRAYRARA